MINCYLISKTLRGINFLFTLPARTFTPGQCIKLIGESGTKLSFHIRESQVKSWKVRDNLRKPGTKPTWFGKILEKIGLSLEFWSVSQISISLQLIYLYS